MKLYILLQSLLLILLENRTTLLTIIISSMTFKSESVKGAHLFHRLMAAASRIVIMQNIILSYYST